jgi:hypothetical protein
MRIKNVHAVYTGGGVWLFYGEMTGGKFFLTDDYGDTLILNDSPENFDESLYPEWQEKHLFKELRGETRERFCLNMLRWLSKPGRDDYRGGITDREIDFYKNYMQGEY